MNLLVRLCAPLLVVCAALPTETQIDVRTSQDRREHDVSGFAPVERKKRVAGLAARLIKDGIRAVTTFTKGAKQLPPDPKPGFNSRMFVTDKTRQFVKVGGTYDGALQRFRSLNPNDVRKFTMPGGAPGFAGNVGDRIIYVKSSHETFGKPTVEIYRMGGLQKGDPAQLILTEIITYGN